MENKRVEKIIKLENDAHTHTSNRSIEMPMTSVDDLSITKSINNVIMFYAINYQGAYDVF